MANDTPKGFQPQGTEIKRVTGYFIKSNAYAGVLCKGDAVKGTNNGHVERLAAGEASLCTGVVEGLTDEHGVPISYSPANTRAHVTLYSTDNDFIAQASAAADFVENMTFEICDIVDAVGDTSTGVSQQEIDLSTVAAAGADDVKIKGKVHVSDNIGVNQDLIVRFNLSDDKGTAGI